MAHTAEKTIRIERLLMDVETPDKLQKLEEQLRKTEGEIKRLERDIASLKERTPLENGGMLPLLLI